MEKHQRVVLTILALAQFMVVLDVLFGGRTADLLGRRESQADARNRRRFDAVGAPQAPTRLLGGPAISTTHEAR